MDVVHFFVVHSVVHFLHGTPLSMDPARSVCHPPPPFSLAHKKNKTTKTTHDDVHHSSST